MTETPKMSPPWFPMFPGRPLEFLEARVIFRCPRTQEISYIMSRNDFDAVMEMGVSIQRHAAAVKTLELLEKLEAEQK